MFDVNACCLLSYRTLVVSPDNLYLASLACVIHNIGNRWNIMFRLMFEYHNLFFFPPVAEFRFFLEERKSKEKGINLLPLVDLPEH